MIYFSKYLAEHNFIAREVYAPGNELSARLDKEWYVYEKNAHLTKWYQDRKKHNNLSFEYHAVSWMDWLTHTDIYGKFDRFLEFSSEGLPYMV